MQDWHDDSPVLNFEMPASPALKDLTPAEFLALGGTFLVYVRPMSGAQLKQMLDDPGLNDNETYHLVVSADCSPLLVADSQEEVDDWLSEKYCGVVSLH